MTNRVITYCCSCFNTKVCILHIFLKVSAYYPSQVHTCDFLTVILIEPPQWNNPKDRDWLSQGNASLWFVYGAALQLQSFSSAWQTNTATSIQLRLRLNAPANFKDTATYSPQTHTSSPLRHISPPAVAPPANQPEETISCRWPQMNGIAQIHVFNKNNKQGCLSNKAPYGNWFITKAQLSSWGRAI